MDAGCKRLKVFSPWLEDKARMGFASPAVLTPQEGIILSLLSRNLSNKEIGNRLRDQRAHGKVSPYQYVRQTRCAKPSRVSAFRHAFAGCNGTDQQAV